MQTLISTGGNLLMAGILLAVGTAVATGLASGIAKTVGGEAAGWVLSEIFGSPDNKEADEIKALGKELDSVEAAVKAVSVQISKDTAEILEELKVINQQQLYTAWEVRDNDLQQYITRLNVQYTRFLQYAAAPKTTSRQDVDNLVSEILDTNNGAGVVMAEIKTLMVGSGRDKGVLALWSQMVEPLIADGTMDHVDALNAYLSYYITAAYAQQRALYLLVEAYHKQNNDPVAEQQRVQYRQFVRAQELPFLGNIERMLRAELKGGEVRESSGIGHTYGYITALQEYSACGFYRIGYNPTQVRNRAERILANSLCLGPDESRVVVWMIYPPLTPYPHYGKNLDFNTVDVPIVEASNPHGEGIRPSYADVLETHGGKMSYDWYNSPHSFKRMVYENVTPGSYVMKDLNGRNGLDPVNGSNQETDYFQAPIYLGHQLIVNEVAKIAFMDFGVYVDRRALT